QAQGVAGRVKVARGRHPQPQPPSIQIEAFRGYLHRAAQPAGAQWRERGRVRGAYPDAVLHGGHAGRGELAQPHLGEEYLGAPELGGDDRRPGRTAHPYHLARPGEQPFEIGRVRRYRLHAEEGQLPAYLHAAALSKLPRSSAEASLPVSTPARAYDVL